MSSLYKFKGFGVMDCNIPFEFEVVGAKNRNTSYPPWGLGDTYGSFEYELLGYMAVTSGM